jgi:hypothetical protein
MHAVGFDHAVQGRVRLVITLINWSKVPPPHKKKYIYIYSATKQQNEHFCLISQPPASDLHPYCSKGGNTLDMEKT